MNLIASKRDSNGLAAVPMRVNRLFDSLFDLGTGAGLTSETWIPPMDVVETPEAIEVLIDLPGIDPKDIDLSIQKDRLEISGQRERPQAQDDTRWYRFERAGGAFHRALRLPVPVDGDKVKASAEHGQLHIVLPKVAEVMPKRIEIKGK